MSGLRCEAIGIDVGGTKTAAARVSLPDGAVLQEASFPTPSSPSEQLELCRTIANQVSTHERLPVGVAVCEHVDRAGQMRSHQTLGFDSVALERAMAHTGHVVTLSDVRAAATAECQLGDSLGVPTVIYLSIGTGISCCLLIDGVVFAGSHGLGLVLGERGLEGRVSGLALCERLQLNSLVGTLQDPVVAAAVMEAGSETGRAVAVLVNALDPDQVIVGGGLGLQPIYRRALESALRRHIDPLIDAELSVQPASFGVHAAVIGAALAAHNHAHR